MARTFKGKTRAEMNKILNFVCQLKEKVCLTEKESDDYDIAVQCVAAIVNRMADNRPLEWDNADS